MQLVFSEFKKKALKVAWVQGIPVIILFKLMFVSVAVIPFNGFPLVQIYLVIAFIAACMVFNIVVFIKF